MVAKIRRALIGLVTLLLAAGSANALHQDGFSTLTATTGGGPGDPFYTVYPSPFGDARMTYCNPLFCNQLSYLDLNSFVYAQIFLNISPPFGGTIPFNWTNLQQSPFAPSRPHGAIRGASDTGFPCPSSTSKTVVNCSTGAWQVAIGDGTGVSLAEMLFTPSVFGPPQTALAGLMNVSDMPAVLPGGSRGTALWVATGDDLMVYQPGSMLEVVFLDPDPILYPGNTPAQASLQNTLNTRYGGNTIFSMLFDGQRGRIDVMAYRLDTREYFLAASNSPIVPIPGAAWLFAGAIGLVTALRRRTR